jgi:hypothetical protein
MNKLKVICLTIMELAKQTCRLPRTMVDAFKQRRQHALLKISEVERLDRIRNPSKYRGK